MKISHAEVNLHAYARTRGPTTSGSRTRGSEATAVTQQRAARRRLQELMSENYKESKIEIPASFIKGGFRPGKTVNSRRVLGSKKTLANVFDDDTAAAEQYFALAAKPSRYPVRPRCNVCGFFASTRCMRCGAPNCSLRCTRVHADRCAT